jgi:hypothetical protein
MAKRFSARRGIDAIEEDVTVDDKAMQEPTK